MSELQIEGASSGAAAMTCPNFSGCPSRRKRCTPHHVYFPGYSAAFVLSSTHLRYAGRPPGTSIVSCQLQQCPMPVNNPRILSAAFAAPSTGVAMISGTSYGCREETSSTTRFVSAWGKQYRLNGCENGAQPSDIRADSQRLGMPAES